MKILRLILLAFTTVIAIIMKWRFIGGKLDMKRKTFLVLAI